MCCVKCLGNNSTKTATDCMRTERNCMQDRKYMHGSLCVRCRKTSFCAPKNLYSFFRCIIESFIIACSKNESYYTLRQLTFFILPMNLTICLICWSQGPDLQLDNQVLPVVSPGGVINKVERIALECQRPEFQAPCKPGQKWQCVTEGNR